MSEKTGKRSKKIILIIIAIVLGAVAIGGLTVAFIFNYNAFSPDKPVVVDDGKTITITTTLNDNYDGYRFVLKRGKEELIIDSEKNYLTSTEIVEKGGEIGKTYKVSVCYLSTNVGNNSELSDELEWMCSVYLATPSVTVEGDSLTWQAVENANSYRVYYGEKYIDVEETSLNLQKLGGGEKTISVVANSNKAGYKSSAASKQLEVQIVYNLEPFIEIEFDKTECIITATCTRKYDKVIVAIGSMLYEVDDFSVTNDNNIYTYKINIKAKYVDDEKIGIKPADIDEYNIYSGEILYVE